MCGIAGFFHTSGAGPAGNRMAAQARAMAAALHHRGPDANGAWSDEEAGVALGHARLSIIDLSPAGAQPMVSSCGRFVIVYNGEIYNADELKRDLATAGRTEFRGHSDTEAVLESCAAFGVRATLEKSVGMFALALWDRRDRCLTLARDRLGIKPLYWGEQNGVLLFASELKALVGHPAFRAEIDRNALAAYLRYNYVPAPASIYKGIGKLEPGCLVVQKLGDPARIERYWDLRRIARDGQANPLALTDADATDKAEALLRDAVGRRMISDVPLGAFLSGGIDSSLVVALMQAQSERPVRTFSIGFAEAAFNEAPHAARVAQHLGTAHTELTVTPDQARDVIPQLAEMYDEPFADSSQIPTFLVSQLTRQHVTVALSGDGGDEVFAGYTRYPWGELLRRRTGSVPRPLRLAAARLLGGLSEDNWDRLLSPLPAGWLPSHPGQKVRKLADVLSLPDDMSLYRRLVSAWGAPEKMVSGSRETPTAAWDDTVADDVPQFLERMQLLDTLTYLPDDILAKVDRASMAVGLEARVPLLDHRVVEFAWQLPRAMRLRGNQGKWLLRQVLYRYVPRGLIERPKMGFGIPVGQWLRGPLRDWAEDLLSRHALEDSGLLDADVVRDAWRRHLSGNRNMATEIWTILMFQAWHRHWMTEASQAA